MKRTLGSVAMVTLMGLALTGCANSGMSRQQTNTAIGAGTGAAIGGVLGNAIGGSTGSTVGGAVVGGAVGAAVGSDWDKRKY
ncbi:MAG: glycine zipper domain-containing protein [Burkholderiaceae bacterium]